jgi:RHS repeat-associated protein
VKKSYTGGTLTETRHFYYTEPSKWQVVEERVDSETDPDRQFVWGQRYIDDLVLRDKDTDTDGDFDERLFAMQDANWNVTGYVDLTGVTVERYVYSPYGRRLVLNESWSPIADSLVDSTHACTGIQIEALPAFYCYRTRYVSTELGYFISRDLIGYFGSDWNLYEYVHGRPLISLDPFGEQSDSVSNAVKKCLEKATIPLQIKCLKDLLGTGNDKLERECETLIRILECQEIHASYSALKCNSCAGVATRTQANANAVCFTAEVAGRSLYLRRKCDYILPGSIKIGSAIAEAGHQAERAKKALNLADCIAKSTDPKLPP